MSLRFLNKLIMDQDECRWIAKLPHSSEGHWEHRHVKIIEYIQSEIHPETMMEIGLNNGTSSSMWLFICPQVKLMSVDIGLHKFVDSVAKKMGDKFGERFTFFKTDSQQLHDMEFPIYDLIFIDGGHQHDVCLSDLNFAVTHARYILVDDTGGKSPGVISALKVFLKNYSLKLIKEWKIRSGCRLFKTDIPREHSV